MPGRHAARVEVQGPPTLTQIRGPSSESGSKGGKARIMLGHRGRAWTQNI